MAKGALFKQISNYVNPANLAVTWCGLFLSSLLFAQRACFLLLLIWLCFALSPFPEIVNGWISLGISCSLLVSAATFFIYRLPQTKLPSLNRVLRQIEESNNLQNRPLRSLFDNLSKNQVNDQAVLRLWQQYQNQLHNHIRHLKWGWRNPQLANIDPFALRHLLLALLLIFSLSSPLPFGEALRQGLWPLQATTTAIVQIDGWITPPAYTGLATHILPKSASLPDDNPDSFKNESQILLPAGSELILQVNHADAPPLFLQQQKEGQSFTQLAQGSFRYRQVMTEDGLYSIEIDGEKLASWSIKTIPDFIPEVSFFGEIGYTSRQSLRLPYQASDDYGIKALDLRLTQITSDPSKSKIIQLPLLKLQGYKRDISSNYFLDLTSHIWAGLQVQAELIVMDGLDQTGISQPQLLTLPQRIFNHPVARQIVNIRKSIALRHNQDFEPEAERLLQLAYDPDAYDNKKAIFMGLYLATRRLIAPDVEEQLNQTLALLWDMALYLEEGEVATS